MPIRPDLYNRLRGRLGDVSIVNEGEGAIANIVTENGRLRLNMAVPGEYMKIDCPFCGDTRQRLWIHHLWGYRHSGTGTLNLWLCCCYNEHCLEDYEKQKQLYRLVYSDVRNPDEPDPLERGRLPSEIRTARSPGIVYPLADLSPGHPARLWMRQRYDVEWLTREYQVGYCQHAEDWCRMAQGRIIIPVFKNGHMVGWQARFVGETQSRSNPKYLTMPGMARAQLLYNWDVASKQSFVALVEGPTAAWTFGREAAATFGKSCTYSQQQLLLEHASRPSFHKQHKLWKAVLILYDGNAYKESIQVYDGLRTLADKVPRILIQLPFDKQPGDYTRAAIRQLAYKQARAEGVEIGELLHDPATAIPNQGTG